jgi:hypothetical protein
MGWAYSVMDGSGDRALPMDGTAYRSAALLVGLLSMIVFGDSLPVSGQEIDKPMFMGIASTGEEVWFEGGRAQCGDLPRGSDCWRNPMISYTLGTERFNTVLDCSRHVFREAWSVSTGNVYKNVRPSSEATRRMVAMACESAAKALQR